jgi:hypothetical protein
LKRLLLTKKNKKWASYAHELSSKIYLVEAERDRILGNDADAREYYDKAISLATKTNISTKKPSPTNWQDDFI